MSLRIGYSFWGYLGDHKYTSDGKEASTPDGNATYSWSIVFEALRRGYPVYPMMIDRDRVGYEKHGDNLFKSFSKPKRFAAYSWLRLHGAFEKSYSGFPELDVLLLEWRFPIPGRNTPADVNKLGYQPDFQRQTELIKHYSKMKTKIIIWDLDHKLTLEDEQYLADSGVATIFETSVEPRVQLLSRTRVEPPVLTEDLLQFETRLQSKHRKLAYIGSRYERDDVIEEWIKPVSNRYPNSVEFWGKWDDEAVSLWPKICFGHRVTVVDFLSIYQTACAVPLLAKKSYMTSGFITPRPWEALMFGSLPIGLKGHLGIENYCLNTAVNAEHLSRLAKDYSELSIKHRNTYREELAHKLSFMDAKHFIDKLELIANESI